MMERFRADVKSPRVRDAFAIVDADIDNVRAAWARLVERDMVRELGRALDGQGSYHWWRDRRRDEGDQLYHVAARALAERLPADQMPAERIRVLVRLMSWRVLFVTHDRRKVVPELLRESQALLERPELADVDVRSEWAFLLMTRARSEELPSYGDARRLCQRSLEIYESLGRKDALGAVHEHWAFAASRFGIREDAAEHFERSVSIDRSSGRLLDLAESLDGLARCMTLMGRFERAERYARESLAIVESTLGAPGRRLELLGWVLICLGQFEEAHAALSRAAAALHEQGARADAAQTDHHLTLAELHLGRYDAARILSQANLEHCEASRATELRPTVLRTLGQAALGAGDLAEARTCFEKSSEFYEGLPLSWAGHAVPLIGLGCVSRREGRPREAVQHLRRAVEIIRRTGVVPVLIQALATLALLLADGGELERTVEVYALAWQHPFMARSRLHEDVAGRELEQIAASLPPAVREAAEARGRERDLWETVEELLQELGAESDAL
jgi:tetratricopeptide (TPR) repeat protein